MYFRHIFLFLFADLRFVLLFDCVFVLFGTFWHFCGFGTFSACEIVSQKKKGFKTALITSFVLLLQIWEPKLPQWYQKRSE